MLTLRNYRTMNFTHSAFILGWNRVMDGIEKAIELGYDPLKVLKNC